MTFYELSFNPQKEEDLINIFCKKTKNLNPYNWDKI